MVQEKVTSGLYSSASEVIREGLRLVQERDAVRQMRLEELRREVRLGIESADRGELVDGAQFLQSLREELTQRAEKQG
jgi:antitoxin ParD1/3/4